ncbi:MAG: site-specific integrase, partial [Erysipelotrichaceae bacterium]|nr:site-specific integrase [Erysipelotrichaceae bacterium]
IIKKKDQTTTYSEVARAVELVSKKTKNPRNRMLYVNALWLDLFSGMRPSEIFALETNAIDFDEKQIRIYQRIGSTSTEKYAIVKVKTESSVRTVDFPPSLEGILRELVDNAIDGYLFKKDNGKLVNGDEFSDRLNKATSGTFRAYTMRHQLTTDLMEQGVDLRTIMEIMGHSESTMTLYYARSNQKKKKEAINNRIINRMNEAAEEKEEEIKTA